VSLHAPAPTDDLAGLLRSAEARLEEAERRHQEVLDSLGDTVFEMDLTGRVTSVNRSAFGRWGYSPDEFGRGVNAFDLVAPEDRHLARQNAARVFAGEQPHAEYRGLRKDGSRFWMSVTSTRTMKEGRPAGLRGLVVDITERKQAEEAIRHSEERYRSLVQNAVFGIYRTDAAGRFAEANPALAAMLGYADASALIGRHISTCFQDPAERDRLVAQYGSTDRIRGLEVQWKRLDGSPLTVRLTGRPVPSDGGGIGFEMIVEDVSERAALEQQFRHAQKMEAIGRLAGGIAHDFNNLLTAMGGYSDLLLNQLAADDPRRRDVDEIRKAAERASALTRQLLAFSRKQIQKPKPVSLSAVLEGVDPLLRRLIGEDVELVTIPGSDAGFVRADPLQLEQVIMNLAVNARDAMPGGGRLTIETRSVTFGPNRARAPQDIGPGRYAMLAVTDTGCGMDEQVKSHLFEPFFTTKEGGRGTGLGLATVDAIVRQSGGRIYVDSEPQQGSTFEVYFPRLDEEAGRAPAVRGVSPSGTETILLAEDEDAVRSLTREILARQGYRVLEARTGGDALSVSAAYAGRIDLLLTDVVMPEMGGRELAQRLLMQRPSLKVVYVSGHADEKVVRLRTLEPGAVFLRKPFTPGGLAAAVRDTLDETRMH